MLVIDSRSKIIRDELKFHQYDSLVKIQEKWKFVFTFVEYIVRNQSNEFLFLNRVSFYENFISSCKYSLQWI